jgi:PAS domain S-box-containing protein
MIRTLEKRIVLFTLLSLSIAILVNTVFNIENYRRDYRDSLILRSHSLANGLNKSIEKVLGFGLALTDLSGIDDRCSVIVTSDPEISYCVVEESSGHVIFGSAGSQEYESSLSRVVTVENSSVVLEFPGQGQFYDVQNPIYLPDGNVAGRVRIGFPVQVLTDKAAEMIRHSIVILLVVFALACVVIIFFVKRDVVKPLRQLGDAAAGIAGGDFDVEIPVHMTRELQELARSFKSMAISLKNRDEELQSNYVQLEESNIQLQESYTRLEEVGRELGRSREMYRSLLEDASDAIIASDDENRIIMINKAAEALFAINRSRAEGLLLIDFFAELEAEEAEGITGLFLNVLHGQSLEAEIKFVRPSDKQTLIGWAKCSSIVDQDGKRMVQTIVRGVTREREVKANLERSAGELERLNTMKDSFLGVASHELKTPLTVILGYTELLLGEMAPLVGTQVLPMIEHINRSAERLSKIVRDMVDVTLLDNQNISIRCHDVDLNKMIHSVVDEMNYFVEKRHQRVVFELTDQVSTVWCDEERIYQVLTNLVSNAIKFTPDHGEVKISTTVLNSHRTPVDSRQQRLPGVEAPGDDLFPYVQIAIQDTGIGIAEKDLGQIFEKFYEVGEIEGHFTAQSAFRGKGTGLGLTIAKGFVDLHGGEIWVESDGHDPENCPGSTFFVLLPINGIKSGLFSS